MPDTSSMPSQGSVDSSVRGIVADLTGISADKIASTFMTVGLTEPPLSLDDAGLRHLAVALDSYAAQKNPKASIVIDDVSKDGETVRDLCDLVYKRIAA